MSTPVTIITLDDKHDILSSKKKLLARIENDFTYHPPMGDQVERYAARRAGAKTFALLIADLSPISRAQSLALTDLQHCVMMANAAIACNE
jgi:hypothetical protein